EADVALAEATAAGDRWATGWALSIRTIVHGMRFETTEALATLDRALAVAEGDPSLADLRLLLHVNQAVALGELGRYSDAISAAHADRPKDAVAALLDGMPGSGDEAGQVTALFADAVRLAVAVGDRSTARLMARRGEAVARGSDIPYRRAVGAHCRGLLDRDPA